MTRPLDLNFAGRERVPGVYGMALLLFGVASVAVTGLYYRNLASEAGLLQARVGAHAGDVAPAGAPDLRRPRGSGRDAATDGSVDQRQLRQEIDRANTLLRQMSVPWEGLFSVLERASIRGVRLTAVHPDASTRQLRLEGESGSVSLALSLVEQLDASSLLEDVHLTGHERLDDGEGATVRFLIAARWKDPA